MSSSGRTHRALLAAAFTYGQFFVALGAVFFVTPQVLRAIGARTYGLWLSSGELVGYFLLLDFGVFSVLPWLIARADGKKDAGEIRRLLSQGLAVACMVLLLLVGAALAGWYFVPRVLHLTPEDWRTLAPPLALLVGLLAVNLPLNLFTPLLGGLQDVKFLGYVGLLKAVAGPVLTLWLLFAGKGLYALAAGTALVSVLVGAAAFLRARSLVPELLQGWPRPTWRDSARLFRESVGGWIGGMGTQMMERSSALVVAYLGNPALVPVLVCTSRIGQMLTQMAWTLPDQALVGLAQLSGENNPTRVREVTLSIVRLNVMLAGLMACEVLAVNPALVRIWVGNHFFGGLTLNLLLSAEVISATLMHGLLSVTAVLGHRLAVGLATLAQGAAYLVLSVWLGRRFALEGVILADVAAPLVSTLPVVLWFLGSSQQIGLSRLAVDLAPMFFGRILPCLLITGGYGYWRGTQPSLPETVLAGGLVGLIYLRVMGSLLTSFPIPEKVLGLFRRLRLL